MGGKFFKLTLATILASCMFLVGCGTSSNKSESSGKDSTENKLPVATITIKDYGKVKAELYPEYAPNTVNNFIYLANSNFYNGLTFHRVIKDFMIQGGDPKGNGSGGPDYTIKGEFPNNGFKQNTLKHTEGVLSMARSSQKDSAGSQFFIMTKEASHLDGDYAAFGKVIEGMDVVHKVESVQTGNNDKPVKEVVIESIKVDTNGVDYKDPEKM
ncbi:MULTISPECIES: peptidylprolyl isomerase [Clostridium]|uniref:Peptidyl-prolyl cis-trans isomerase n=1 Tax=Clostridium cibarium TaxID=2762247 RepID=A0ABR8PU19_9CLOT|nr:MULTISPECIES: peptidylprolyl isomerase [Clostridium]MBD7911670.1 peptidylprolyl isomerase [Clostridium cibarium]